MTDPIEMEMRATYARCKRYWTLVMGLWAVAAVVASASVAPLPQPLPQAAIVLAFVCTVATYALRWRADAIYQTAECLRRNRLLADGLGEEADPSDLARIRSRASQDPGAGPAPIGAYYTSAQAIGWRRVLDNVQESAFYTHDLATFAWQACAAIVACTVLGAVIVMFVTQNLPMATSSVRVVGSVTLGVVTAVVGGSIADVGRAYLMLSRAAEACFERAKVLLASNDLSERDAITAMAAYEAAVANAPPIPTFVYMRMRSRLDGLWASVRSSRASVPPVPGGRK